MRLQWAIERFFVFLIFFPPPGFLGCVQYDLDFKCTGSDMWSNCFPKLFIKEELHPEPLYFFGIVESSSNSKVELAPLSICYNEIPPLKKIVFIVCLKSSP